jgi:oxygen-independent coproporphyrinogen III oxidase
LTVKGLYVHFPFCVRKCRYCDFYSIPRPDLIESYIPTLLRESHEYNGLSFQTLYIGGGTPSLLGADHLRNLIGGLRESFDLSGLVESTIEVNPDSASRELFEAAKESGINRISIGVQSLSDDELQSVGRIHNPEQAIKAIKQAANLGFERISADVIVGLPGQTWKTLHKTLEALIETGVQHLSVYCLSLEEGTPLALSPPPNLPSDDEQAELFGRSVAFLTGHSYVHYEISNFAQKGCECLHNLNYWRGGEYLGLGPAAASHLKSKRFKNTADLPVYMKNPTALVEGVEQLDPRRKAAEEAMLRLRLLEEGVDAAELNTKFGGDASPVIMQLDSLTGKGMLLACGSRYKLAPAMVLTSNPIFAEIIGC